ncbi:hypothetical protein [Methanobacterium sp.]|uniref:hypothetical protein n=1 Tax=Methanobacterium sp. TaxID=2164 RepID=UPI003C748F45
MVDPGIVTSYSASVQESAENNSQKEISSYNTRAGTCLTWATILTVLTGALFTAGFLGVFLAPVTAGTSLVLTSLDSFCVFTVVGFIIGFSLYGIFHDLANSLKNKFKDNKEDLDRYTKPIKVTNMDVDTYDGIPILNQTTIPDYKSYQFLLIDPSEHGDVLPGPGIQFLYGPNDGFTGNDTFKFEYSQNGKPVGIMIVNIQIKPLPMFNKIRR